MKKILSILTISLCLVGFSACSGFLDVKPSNSSSADDLPIKTPGDVKVMISGLQRAMTSYAYYGRNMLLYADAKGGDFVVRALGRGNDYLYTFNHSATSGSGVDYWSQIYYCILQTNNLLMNIERIEAEGGTTPDLTGYKGQVLTMRALMYFDLVRIYGKPYTQDNGASLGVPIVTQVLKANAKTQRSTVAQVYTQILKDLTDAAPMLSTTTYKTPIKGYANYYTNKAIQARVYLYMGDMTNALSAAEEVITSGKYTLYANDKWVASWSSEFGSESIYELGIYADEADLGTTSWGAYLMRTGEVSSNILGWFMGSTPFLARLNEDPSDIRKGIMKRDETSASRLGCCGKYTGVDNKGDKGTYSAVNMKVIRLSEMYLIAAEAALPTNTTKAATYLQQIRKRSPGLAPATASTVTLDMILSERSKELFAEGHRFFDMMRLNKSITFDDSFVQGSISTSLRPQTIDRTFYKTILPIPQGELDANPEIRSQQNPNY